MKVNVEYTRSYILPDYQKKIDSLRTFIVSKSSDYEYIRYSIISAFRFRIIPGFDKDAENRIKKYIIKYVIQWYFIGSTLDIAISQFKTPDLL